MTTARYFDGHLSDVRCRGFGSGKQVGCRGDILARDVSQDVEVAFANAFKARQGNFGGTNALQVGERPMIEPMDAVALGECLALSWCRCQRRSESALNLTA